MARTDRVNPIRRRLLLISAVAAGSALIGPGGMSFAGAPVQRWKGVALGAGASIELIGVSPAFAADLFQDVESELDRLEDIFSLYRRQSALSRLNAQGRLDAPPPELLEVLSTAKSVHARTEGLFDPTVQPLFELYASYWGGGEGGPSAAQLADALDKVGLARVSFSEGHIAFERSGMALTLNGIAQGYISDRIGQLLGRAGLENILVDMGEIVARGDGPSGRGWRVGLPRSAGGLNRILRVSGKAVATSALKGTVLDRPGLVGHIFHPLRGPVAASFDNVTVVHQSAAQADAFSTAAALMTPAQIARARGEGWTIYV